MSLATLLHPPATLNPRQARSCLLQKSGHRDVSRRCVNVIISVATGGGEKPPGVCCDGKGDICISNSALLQCFEPWGGRNQLPCAKSLVFRIMFSRFSRERLYSFTFTVPLLGYQGGSRYVPTTSRQVRSMIARAPTSMLQQLETRNSTNHSRKYTETVTTMPRKKPISSRIG